MMNTFSILNVSKAHSPGRLLLAKGAAVLATVLIGYTSPMQAANTIITPTFVSGMDLGVFLLADEVQLTNNSGMSLNVDTGDSLVAAQSVTHLYNSDFEESYVTNANGADYFSSNPPPPTFVWDLGSDVPLSHIVLWQYQNNGGNNLSIGNHTYKMALRFNTNTEGDAIFSGSAHTVTMKSVKGLSIGGTTNSAQTFSLTPGGNVRYVQMTLTDNHFGNPAGEGVTGGGDRIGLGEVRFAQASVVPEPSTYALMGSMLAAVAVRRKRCTQ